MCSPGVSELVYNVVLLKLMGDMTSGLSLVSFAYVSLLALNLLDSGVGTSPPFSLDKYSVIEVSAAISTSNTANSSLEFDTGDANVLCSDNNGSSITDEGTAVEMLVSYVLLKVKLEVSKHISAQLQSVRVTFSIH